MEKSNCDCSKCENWVECEISLIVHNPYVGDFDFEKSGLYSNFTITKGDRIAQIMLCEHKSFLFGIESEVKRVGGMGSTGNE